MSITTNVCLEINNNQIVDKNHNDCSDNRYKNLCVSVDKCSSVNCSQDSSDLISVKGRLKQNIDFWISINSNEYVLDVIKNGYKLPFKHFPQPAHLKNNRSSLDNDEFVKVAISDLLKTGAAVEVFEKPTVVNPLTVAQNSKKKRLVLDLRHVNQCLIVDKIKFEDWKTALLYADKDNYMFSFDLKSGYHHIDIHEDFHQYLGFSWVFGDTVRYFKFTVLPFGLATAGHIFTKTVRCLVKHWRSSGMKIVVYLDDGLGFSESFKSAKIFSDQVKSDLEKSGLVQNEEKSTWEPTQSLIWLGIGADLSQGKLFVTDKRIQSTSVLIKSIIARPRTTARKLAKITGKIISMSLVFGNITNLMLRYSHMSIIERISWDSYFNVNTLVLNELIFWDNNLEKLNHRFIHTKIITERIVYSDASSTGCGGFIVDIQDSICYRSWDVGEKEMSSTYRELQGVYTVICSMPDYLRGKRVRWYTDNQAVVSIVHKGSMKRHLQDLAINIYKFACSNSIDVFMEWIPRSENEKADMLSRIIDHDDWQISDSLFKYLNFLWGPFTFDRFADSNNKKLNKFNSRFWSPGTCGVDAFSFSWEGENNWLVPPICLISRCIKYIQNNRVNATLVVPYWPSSVFWPLIVNYDFTYKQFISKAKKFDNAKGFFIQGSVPSVFNQGYKGAVLALNFVA